MSDERVRTIAEEALNRLSAELEAGKSEALKNYLETMGRFHRYSSANILLIHSQRPAATRVAGFHAWHDLGRHVKKGEKGIIIFAPVLKKQKDSSPDLNRAEKPEQAVQLTGFRTAYVYDVAQTDGRALPEFAKTTGDPKDYTDKLKALVSKQGISLDFDPNITPAQGISGGGQIRLRPGLSPAEEFSVLTHELAHEMLHHRNETRRLPAVIHETQAEAVAYVVCRGIGLETNTAAADYIKLYNGNKQTLAESLSVIQQTSAEILDELLPQERRMPSSSTEVMRETASPDPQQEHSEAPAPAAHQQRPAESPEAPTWDR